MKLRQILALSLAALLLAGVIGLYFFEKEPPEVPEAGATEPVSAYVPREDLTVLLVMGLDKYQAPQDTMGYLNDQQADFLLLLAADRSEKTCKLLHVNRDTMTEIRRLGLGGGTAGKFQGQLALAHTYGSGGSDSCINTVKAVSGLLKGARIDHYLSMTMDGVSRLNDLVGGVTVQVLDDMTAKDPALEKGKTVVLQGDQALTYVRSRGGLEDSTNLHRMERQRQYLNGLYTQLIRAMDNEEDFLSRSLLEIPFQSDCSVNQLSELGDLLKSCTLEPILTLPGEAVKGEEFIEFYVDEKALDQVLIDIFCE